MGNDFAKLSKVTYTKHCRGYNCAVSTYLSKCTDRFNEKAILKNKDQNSDKFRDEIFFIVNEINQLKYHRKPNK